MHTANAQRFANEANSLLEELCIYQRGLRRSWPAFVSSSLSLPASSFFILLQGFFFNKIQSERISEANIHSFVWRLVKEKKGDASMWMRTCACVFVCVLWPFVDSWCRVNVIMTSRDEICFLGSCIIQPLWGVKRSTAKQHQQTVKAFYIYSHSRWHHHGFLDSSNSANLCCGCLCHALLLYFNLAVIYTIIHVIHAVRIWLSSKDYSIKTL